MPAHARRVLILALVLCAFLALAVFETWPLAVHFTTHLPGAGGSTYHMAWILAWGAHALATDPRRLFEANLAYPIEHSFAFSEHMLGAQPFFAPVYALTGNPTAGHNTVFVLSFALSAFAAFCLSWYWTRQVWPSLVAGTLFGFAPFRFGHLNHLHTLVFFWAPLALLFLDRFLLSRRWRDLGAFALFYWLQALSSIQLAVMTSLAVALYAAVWALAVDRSVLTRAVAVKALAFAAASVAVLGPVHVPYLLVRLAWGSPWTTGTLVGGSADLRDYLLAPPLVNDVYAALSRRIAPQVTEDGMLFPGLVLPALALLGLSASVRGVTRRDRRDVRLLFGVLAAAAIVLSLGPYLLVGGHNLRIPLPYLLLYEAVPGWGSIRIPARFALLAVLAATPLAALGVMWCAEALGTRRLAAPAAAAVLVAAALGELGGKPLPLAETPIARVPAAYRWLARERPGPVLEVPFGIDFDMRNLYLSTVHWLPVVTPRGSFAPAPHDQLKEVLERLPAPRALQYAGALGVKAIVVDTSALEAGVLDRWRVRERSDPPLRRLGAFPPHLVYAVPPVAAAAAITARLEAPPWLPAGRRVRLGLALAPRDGRPWRHPAPHGTSGARLVWTGASADHVATESVDVALPLVVGDDGVVVPLPARAPARPGRYHLRVTIPERGVDAGPADVEVIPVAPPTSLDAARLAARYVTPMADEPLKVAPLDYLPLRLEALNTGEAVWLAKASGARGVVALHARWLRDGREVAAAGRPARIRADVFPGQACAFALEVPTPPEPGTYALELGLASAGVATFARAGSPPLLLRVEVGEPPARPAVRSP